MHAPGTYYKASGRFEPKRLAIFTLTGILFAFFIGWLYYILCRINPFTFLNFIILGLAMFASMIIFTFIIGRIESRNEKLDLTVLVLLCYLTWSSQWAFFNLYWHYGYSFWGGLLNPLTTLKIIGTRANQVDIYGFPFGRGFQYIWYISELAAFMLVAKFIAGVKTYFCEDCKQYYVHRHSHLREPEIENFYLLKEMAGEDHQYRFLPQLVFVKKLTAVYAERIPVIKVTLYYCTKCHENNIVDVSSHMQEMDTSNQLQTPLIKKQPITVGMYIDRATADALHRKFM